jgi:hypothetical protein
VTSGKLGGMPLFDMVPPPLPPHSSPTGPYEYVKVKFDNTVKPVFNTLYTRDSLFQAVDRDFLQRVIPADFQTFVDGSRVYRVNVKFLWRLPNDRLGSYIGYSEAPLRFQIDDPSIGKQITQSWTPSW